PEPHLYASRVAVMQLARSHSVPDAGVQHYTGISDTTGSEQTQLNPPPDLIRPQICGPGFLPSSYFRAVKIPDSRRIGSLRDCIPGNVARTASQRGVLIECH